jgi:predicted HAD superfamily hydrolase
MMQTYPNTESKAQMQVQSFDVFDTVLVRIWAKPIDLFWELGVQLQQAQIIQVSPDTWQRWRVDAETAARQKTPTGEVNLYQIYDQLMVACGWGVTAVEIAIQYEIRLECASLCPVPTIQRKIQALRQQNYRIAFLSDMYLPTEVICGFLKDHQIWVESDVLLVSGDIGVNKSSGKLFQHYLTQHQLALSQLHHIGDNLHSDVTVPKALGIQAQPFLQTHLNRYEHLITDNEQLPLRFRSLLAGASRLCRLHCQETDLHKQTIWNTAANVAAPILFGFVHWVLLEAKRQGIQRLYFVARDGQILWQIAQIISCKWGYDIDCRYLYGSRQAFHFAAIQEIGEAELDWLFPRFKFISVQIVCEQVNLQPERIADTLISHGFPPENWGKNLTEKDFTALKKVFQSHEVVNLIIELATTHREKAINYFKQEGICDGVSFALVDVGWSGGSQRSFSKILASYDLYPKTGVREFYFGVEKVVKALLIDRIIPYFLKANDVTKRLLLCHKEILELFLAADHGSTIRYEKQEHYYSPVLRSEKNTSGIEWGVLIQQQAILEYTKLVTDNLHSEECEINHFYQVTEDLLEAFINKPSREEAEVFGTQIFSHQQTESEFYQLAPAYTFADGCRMLFDKQYLHDFVWLSASIQRSSPLTKILLWYNKKLKHSNIYVVLGWRAFEASDNHLALEFIRKALKSFPPIVSSIHFLRLTSRIIMKP